MNTAPLDHGPAAPNVQTPAQPSRRLVAQAQMQAAFDLVEEQERRIHAGDVPLDAGQADAFKADATAHHIDRLQRDKRQQRAELLATAADVLRSRWPSVRGDFKSRATGLPYTYRFELPGVLRVFRRSSGECVAESLPGSPGELSAADALSQAEPRDGT